MNVFSDFKGWKTYISKDLNAIINLNISLFFFVIIYCLHWWTVNRQCLACCSLPVWKKSSECVSDIRCWVCIGQHSRRSTSVLAPSDRCFARALWKLSRESGSEGTSYYKSQILLSVKVHNNTRLAHIAVAQEPLDMPHSYVEVLIIVVV